MKNCGENKMSKYTPATFQPTVRPDWAGILSYLSDKEKIEILTALFKYPSEISENCQSAFWKEVIKPDLDLQYQAFTESCKAKSRGVRNRWGKISITDVEDMNKTSIRYGIDTEREREREEKSEEEKIGGTGGKEKGGFVPPTLEEVLEYAREQNSFAGVGGFACTPEQATDFFNQYDRQGWLLGNGIHMANWRSGLMKWAQNKRQPQPTNRPPILNLTARERQDLINKEKTQALLKQLKAQGN